MPKVQVYLPEPLYARVKARLRGLNVSAVVQRALEQELAELDRQKALDRAIRSYEREHGRITDEQMDAVVARDRALARRPNAPRRAKKKRAA